MKYLYFCDYLILHSIICSKFIPVVAYDRISFFFFKVNNVSLYVYITFSLSIYSSTDGHKGCFHLFFAIVNNAAEIIGVYRDLLEVLFLILLDI